MTATPTHIISVSHEPLSAALNDAYLSAGMHVTVVEPSFLGPFTATAVMAAAKRLPAPVRAIVVHRLSDAPAAHSASRAIEGQPLVVAALRPGDNPDRRSASLARYVDRWAMPGPATAAAWHAIAPPQHTYIVPEPIDNPIAPPRHVDTRTLLFYQPQLTDTERLRDIIQQLPEHPGTTLHVIGQGKPRHIMPLVRLARNIAPDTVIWHGDNMAYDDPMLPPCIAVAVHPDTLAADRALLAAGYTLCTDPYDPSTQVAPSSHSTQAHIDALLQAI